MARPRATRVGHRASVPRATRILTGRNDLRARALSLGARAARATRGPSRGSRAARCSGRRTRAQGARATRLRRDGVRAQPRATRRRAAGRRAVRRDRARRSVCGSLPRARRSRAAPSAARARAPYDLVVLGWGSITHVLEEDDRLALLESVRALAPSAPVITSFFLRPEPGHGGRTERLRRARFARPSRSWERPTAQRPKGWRTKRAAASCTRLPRARFRRSRTARDTRSRCSSRARFRMRC
jgi:hypothetical protein